MDVPKKMHVPLDEALSRAGVGLYTYYVILVTGLVLFASILGVQVMSVILPVAGCELALSGFQKGMLTSSTYGGMMASSFVFGFLADTYGRRRVILWCGLLYIVFSLMTSLAPEPISLTVLWTLNGFVLGGVFSPVWAYVAEFCPQWARAKGILVPACLSSLGQVYLPCMAWLILPLEIAYPVPLIGVIFTPWRLYLALLALPASLTMVMLYFLPDSPKYLLNKGRDQEALRILSSIYAVNNGKKRSDYPVEYLCLDLEDMLANQKEAPASSNHSCLRFFQTLFKQMEILFSPPHLFFMVLTIVQMFGIVGPFNALFLWFPEQVRILMQEYDTDMDYNATICDIMSMHGKTTDEGTPACQVNEDIFIIGMIAAIFQSTLVLIISLIADRIGRKLLMLLFLGLSIGTHIGMIYANTFLLTISTLGLTIILLSVMFPLSYSIILDYFPTSVRSTASSIGVFSGRFGASAGSQVLGAMFENHCSEAYWGMTAILVATWIVIAMSPTKRMP